MQPRVVACVLAGGLSSRLGRDKARVRLGRRTLLGRIKAAAKEAGLPVKVLRRDIVPRCGPIGGIYTGLCTLDAEAIVFLACDMPFVSAALLNRLVRAYLRSGRPIFVESADGRGFPCVVPKRCAPLMGRQIEKKEWSIQVLSRALKAKVVPFKNAAELFNVNTARDLATAREKARSLRPLR